MLTPEEWAVVNLSVQVAAMSMVLVAIPGIGVGWLLARCDFHGKSVVDAVIHLPLVLPPVVTGYVLLLLCGRRGPIGVFCEQWLGFSIAFTWKGAVLAAAVMAFPLMVRSVRLAIELGDPRLEDAARTLGAGWWRVLFTITLPLAAPGILAGLVLTFARSLGEFGATITLCGNIAGESRTLPVAIYTATQIPDGDAEAQRLTIISIVIAVLALVAAEWLHRRWAKRIGSGGVGPA